MTTYALAMHMYQNEGEPTWMPSPEQVERARAAMERAGVPASFTRWGLAPAPLVAEGETPWIWWVVAGLWVLIWPALVALKAGAGWLPALPWWVLALLAGMHLLTVAWPVWVAEHSAGRTPLRRRFGQIRTLAGLLALEPPEFEVWTSLLFELMGYKVDNTPDVGDHGIDLIVSDGQISRGIVQCKRYRGTVGEPTVRDLFGTMTAEHAAFGWLVTTGAVSRQARDWAAGKPLILWDGRDLVNLARKYR